MFGRRKRRERRIRERGRPAVATVLEARPAGDGAWDLRLHVTPEADPPFTARARAALPAGATVAVGSTIQVLHDPGNRSRVVLAGVPAGLAPGRGAGWADAAPADAGDPPDPLEALRQVFAGLADGTTLGAGQAGDGVVIDLGTTVQVGGEPVDVAPAPGAEDLDLNELKDLGRTHPGALAFEVMRRLASGELTPQEIRVHRETIAAGADAPTGGPSRMQTSFAAQELIRRLESGEISRRAALAEARDLTRAAGTADAIIDAVRATGRLTPEQLELVRRRLEA